MMTAEQLKGSILQLAMQGKLVEQRPEEGTGEELYKEIQEEKKRLIKAGSLKADKAEYDGEEDYPVDIPDSWKWVKFGDLFDIGSAIRIHQTDWKKEGIPFFRGRELVRLVKTGEPDAEIYITQELYEKNKAKGGVPQKDDLLVSAVGTIGKVYIVKGTKPFYYKDAYILRFNNYGHLYPKYFKYVIESPFEQAFIKEGSMGTTVAQLTIMKAKRMLCPLPPLAEQKRIVAKIEELMPFVEQYAVASTNLNVLNTSFPEMMKKSILQEAVQGKLVPQDPNDEPASVLLKKIAEEKKRLIKEGKIKKQKPLPEITEDEIPFDIPESWEWVRFGDIYTMSNGIAKRAGTTGEFIGVLRLADLSEGVIDTSSIRKIMLTEKEQQAYLLKRNDLIMIRVNGSKGKVGTAFVYDHIEKTAYCDHLFRARSIGEDICPEYIALVFNTTIIRNTFKNEIKTTAGQNTISQESLKNVLIPLPPMCEQERIVDRVCEILPSISLLRE